MNKVDLLSVVMHEIGHVLGYDHDSNEVMSETLGIGTRTIDESPTLETSAHANSAHASANSQSHLIDWNGELSTLALGWNQGLGRGRSEANFPSFSLEGSDNDTRQPDAKKKWLYENSTDEPVVPRAEVQWHIEI